MGSFFSIVGVRFHFSLFPLRCRFIKTTTTALVEHLSKYLAMRISLELFPSSTSSGAGGDSAASGSVKDLKIFIAPTPGQKVTRICHVTICSLPSLPRTWHFVFCCFSPMRHFVFKVELSGSMSLTEANEKYWKVNKPMEMFYSFQTS